MPDPISTAGNSFDRQKVSNKGLWCRKNRKIILRKPSEEVNGDVAQEKAPFLPVVSIDNGTVLSPEKVQVSGFKKDTLSRRIRAPRSDGMSSLMASLTCAQHTGNGENWSYRPLSDSSSLLSESCSSSITQDTNLLCQDWSREPLLNPGDPSPCNPDLSSYLSFDWERRRSFSSTCSSSTSSSIVLRKSKRPPVPPIRSDSLRKRVRRRQTSLSSSCTLPQCRPTLNDYACQDHSFSQDNTSCFDNQTSKDICIEQDLPLKPEFPEAFPLSVEPTQTLNVSALREHNNRAGIDHLNQDNSSSECNSSPSLHTFEDPWVPRIGSPLHQNGILTTFEPLCFTPDPQDSAQSLSYERVKANVIADGLPDDSLMSSLPMAPTLYSQPSYIQTNLNTENQPPSKKTLSLSASSSSTSSLSSCNTADASTLETSPNCLSVNSVHPVKKLSSPISPPLTHHYPTLQWSCTSPSISSSPVEYHHSSFFSPSSLPPLPPSLQHVNPLSGTTPLVPLASQSALLPPCPPPPPLSPCSCPTPALQMPPPPVPISLRLIPIPRMPPPPPPPPLPTSWHPIPRTQMPLPSLPLAPPLPTSWRPIPRTQMPLPSPPLPPPLPTSWHPIPRPQMHLPPSPPPLPLSLRPIPSTNMPPRPPPPPPPLPPSLLHSGLRPIPSTQLPSPPLPPPLPKGLHRIQMTKMPPPPPPPPPPPLPSNLNPMLLSQTASSILPHASPSTKPLSSAFTPALSPVPPTSCHLSLYSTSPPCSLTIPMQNRPPPPPYSHAVSHSSHQTIPKDSAENLTPPTVPTLPLIINRCGPVITSQVLSNIKLRSVKHTILPCSAGNATDKQENKTCIEELASNRNFAAVSSEFNLDLCPENPTKNAYLNNIVKHNSVKDSPGHKSANKENIEDNDAIAASNVQNNNETYKKSESVFQSYYNSANVATYVSKCSGNAAVETIEDEYTHVQREEKLANEGPHHNHQSVLSSPWSYRTGPSEDRLNSDVKQVECPRKLQKPPLLRKPDLCILSHMNDKLVDGFHEDASPWPPETPLCACENMKASTKKSCPTTVSPDVMERQRRTSESTKTEIWEARQDYERTTYPSESSLLYYDIQKRGTTTATHDRFHADTEQPSRSFMASVAEEEEDEEESMLRVRMRKRRSSRRRRQQTMSSTMELSSSSSSEDENGRSLMSIRNMKGRCFSPELLIQEEDQYLDFNGECRTLNGHMFDSQQLRMAEDNFTTIHSPFWQGKA